MAKKKKPQQLNEVIFNRAKKIGFDINNTYRCVICGGDFKTCPHDIGTHADMIIAAQMFNAVLPLLKKENLNDFE